MVAAGKVIIQIQAGDTFSPFVDATDGAEVDSPLLKTEPGNDGNEQPIA